MFISENICEVAPKYDINEHSRSIEIKLTKKESIEARTKVSHLMVPNYNTLDFHFPSHDFP